MRRLRGDHAVRPLGRPFLAGHLALRVPRVDFANHLSEDQTKFCEKCAKHQSPKPLTPAEPKALGGPCRPALALTAAGALRVVTSPGKGLRLAKRRSLISLCMIVRDNSGTIEAALASVKPWVDEMIVVDTGSKDDTPKICRRLGARVYEFPWCDSFSAARNESLKYATGDWVFWMDSDDVMPADQGPRLRSLVAADLPVDAMGFIMQVHCPYPSDDGDCDVTVVDHCKLFRNRPDARFEFRIHEQVLPSIRRAGGEPIHTDVYVVHSGADHSPPTRRRKLRRDVRLLKLDLAENPKHPFVLFNIGMTLADADWPRAAERALRQCIDVTGDIDSHLRKAYALLAGSLMAQGKPEDALAACQNGLTRCPNDPELAFRSAIALHELGRLREAEQAYLKAMLPRDERPLSSMDQGIQGYKARHNLASIYHEMGRLAECAAQWRLALTDRPDYWEGWRRLGVCLLDQGDGTGFLELLRELSRRPSLRGVLHWLEAEQSLRNGRHELAKVKLQEALRSSPDHPVILDSLARWAFDAGTAAEAEGALRNLVRVASADASAWHNLGVACRMQKKLDDAAAALRRSLRLRPGNEVTCRELEAALAEQKS